MYIPADIRLCSLKKWSRFHTASLNLIKDPKKKQALEKINRLQDKGNGSIPPYIYNSLYIRAYFRRYFWCTVVHMYEQRITFIH